MAKKVKTPEEVKASIDKRVARRKIFFGTFSKALALFLAVAMVYTLAAIAFMPPQTVQVSSNTNNSQNVDDDNDDAQTPGDDTQTPGDDAQTPGDDTQKPGDNTQSTDKISNADAVKLLNDASAKAANAKSYMLDRKSDFLEPGIVLDSESMKEAADALIKRFGGESLTATVGSLFGRGDEKGVKHVNGKTGDESFVHPNGDTIWNCEKYTLKPMKLTTGDLKSVEDKGNGVYVFKLKDCATPEKDNNNPMHHFTNDFTAPSDVNKSLKDSTKGFVKLKDESTMKYENITLTATIKDGTLTELKVHYTMDARAVLTGNIKGKGKAQLDSRYYDFVY